MPLIAGACTITEPVLSPTGQVITPPVVAGTGLALAIAQATMAPAPIGSTSQTSLQSWCNSLAAAIVNHIVTNASVTVSVVAGIPVTTAGTAAAQTGATTAPGAGSGTVA